MIPMLERKRTSRGHASSDGIGSLGYLALMSDETLIAEAGRRLAEAAPDARVILFGSRARGEGRSGSDLDLLVIEPDLKSRRAEFVRLREALGDLGVPVDLFVVSDRHVEQWGQVRGGMIHDALRDGRVLVGG
jgi:predicted nucleotidyltransferase